WLIIFPPASTAACIRVTANSAGTKTSTCILTGPSEGSTSSTGIVLSGRCKNRIGLSTSDRSTNISVWPEPSASLKSKTAFQNGLMASILGVTKRSEEHTSELQSRFDLVCRLLLEKKKHMT